MRLTIYGNELYYEILGKGKVLLCLHGYGVDHLILKETVERSVIQAEEQYQRIYVDLPGMGQSQASSELKNADEMLAVLLEFIDKVIGNEAFLIIGNSYGCYLARGIEDKLKKQVSALFLLCPVVIAKQEKRKLPEKITRVAPSSYEMQKNNEFYQEFVTNIINPSEYAWDRYQQEIIPGILKADDDFLTYFQKNGYEFSFEEVLNQTICEKPIVFLLGKQDQVVGFEDSLQLAPYLPNSSYSILNSAGHTIQIDQAFLVMAHLQDFLKKHKTSPSL